MEEMRVVRGLSATTIYGRRHRLASLQRWLGERHGTFMEVGVNDIDDYMDVLRTKGFRPRSVLTICETIRDFFRFCEARDWCEGGIARGIVMPRLIHRQTGPRGPAWKDVRRMLSMVGTDPLELRANAIINLCSIYGLRKRDCPTASR